jgi:hypothetical protein
LWVNKLMATTMDVLGGSSYLWHWKHAVFHHSYVNIAGHDTDINLGMFARLTPHQKRFMFHRWQYGEVLSLLENETGMHSCLDHKPSVAGWRRRQEEASPWSREYRPQSGQARSSMSC